MFAFLLAIFSGVKNGYGQKNRPYKMLNKLDYVSLLNAQHISIDAYILILLSFGWYSNMILSNSLGNGKMRLLQMRESLMSLLNEKIV